MRQSVRLMVDTGIPPNASTTVRAPTAPAKSPPDDDAPAKRSSASTDNKRVINPLKKFLITEEIRVVTHNRLAKKWEHDFWRGLRHAYAELLDGWNQRL